MKFAIVISRFNDEITGGLLEGALSTLQEKGTPVLPEDLFYVPGAFEIPLFAKKLASTQRFDGIVCLGAVIKGETAHFEFISAGATLGLMTSMLQTETPIGFGIITTLDRAQAKARSQNDAKNKGREAALACYESAQLLREI